MDRKRRAVFIASLDHSGSTLLDMILGTLSSTVGLGEIALTLKSYGGNPEKVRSRQCSCGRIAEECKFWGQVLPGLSGSSDEKLSDGYEQVLKCFQEVFGRDTVLVDSSKYLDALNALADSHRGKLSVIHLLKDVRAFTISRLDRNREKSQVAKRLPAFRQFRAWYRVNRRIEQYLNSRNVEHIRLGYEELCLGQSQVMLLLRNLLDIPAVSEDSMIDLVDSESHVLFGNRMRLQSEKKTITYDARWFVRQDWWLPGFLMPQVMNYNSKRSYSNEIIRPYRG